MSPRGHLWLLLALALGGVTGMARAQGTPAPAAPAAQAATPEQAAPVPEQPAAAPEPAQEDLGASGAARDASGQAEAEPLALSAAELESLGLEVNQPVDTSIHFSGFMDFTVLVPIKANPGLALGTSNKSTFFLGNLNLYLSKNLNESFRTMAEVRFTYLPNGALEGQQPYARIDTSVRDYTNGIRFERWGGIILQRAYLEWTIHRLAVLRAGQYLTPYGIWNVDHGSPAMIPVNPPYVINNEVFPQRQTGFELFGRWDASNYSTLGYHLTFSNGTGPLSEYKDLDRNKAVGGRVYWEYQRLGYLRVGASGYYGTNTASSLDISLDQGALKVKDKIQVQYDSLALGADVLFKYKGVHFQTEWASVQRRYSEDGRTVQNLFVGDVARAFPQDAFSWGWYGLVGYQLPWWALTPYIMPQYSAEVMTGPTMGLHLRLMNIIAGINFHPIDAVTIKAEYFYTKLLSAESLLGNRPSNVVQFQAAWAF